MPASDTHREHTLSTAEFYWLEAHRLRMAATRTTAAEAIRIMGLANEYATLADSMETKPAKPSRPNRRASPPAG